MGFYLKKIVKEDFGNLCNYALLDDVENIKNNWKKWFINEYPQWFLEASRK